jgi:hypothetical protein
VFVTKAPKKKTRAKKVKLSFAATERATFACRLDSRAPVPCVSPFRVKVKVGKHSIRVFATDQVGLAALSPGLAKFRKIKRK